MRCTFFELRYLYIDTWNGNCALFEKNVRIGECQIWQFCRSAKNIFRFFWLNFELMSYFLWLFTKIMAVIILEFKEIKIVECDMENIYVSCKIMEIVRNILFRTFITNGNIKWYNRKLKNAIYLILNDKILQKTKCSNKKNIKYLYLNKRKRQPCALALASFGAEGGNWKLLLVIVKLLFSF